jgi:hypothetical protein
MVLNAPLLVVFFVVGSRGVEQVLKLHDKGVPIAVGDGIDPSIHADCIKRTGLDAVPAIDALQKIDGKFLGHLLGYPIQSLAGFNLNAFCRAVGLAHETGNAFDGIILMLGQTVAAPPAYRDFRGNFGIMSDIKPRIILKVPEQMTEGGCHPLKNLNQIELLDQG